MLLQGSCRLNKKLSLYLLRSQHKMIVTFCVADNEVLEALQATNSFD